ncbi:MAG: acetoacetate--CoA ligase [Planctomycetota bacterium]|nr:MAG: acetoacetate--CoA ligase [Planctomycetota bacterium]
MGKLLWKPSNGLIRQANMTRFIDFVNDRQNLQITSYSELLEWSVENIPDFWEAFWDFGEIIASRKHEQVVEDLSVFPGTKWFPGARLNFAENLLRFKDDQLAFIFKGETRISKSMTYAELNETVARLAKALRETGVQPGDCVSAYMPNLPETIIAMLAATSIGAVWASCGAELGPTAVLDRLGQIQPKVLFTVDGYFYKDKKFEILNNTAQVASGIPSLNKVVVVPYTGETPDLSIIPGSVHYDEFLSAEKNPELLFEQLPFGHPVYIMFSSGTTGKPKCMVQSAGGILINHLKELLLHTDMKREDRICYISSPSWMMWNWMVSSLAVGATIVLYDGNPLYPDWGCMWKLIQDEKVTIFGCSASYILYLSSVGAQPGKEYDLSSLREISQTASVLPAEGFEWLYREVKEDFHFNSISGGTDINGCFAAGSPTLPVYAGELQAVALGMKVKAYDDDAKAVVDQKGELVCEAPSPSMPLYFWNDSENEKYNDAYFNRFKSIGKNVWHHGDYIIIHSDTGGVTFFGRSDAVLKPSGVRLGTAEIYEVVETLPEVEDSLAIGYTTDGDQQIILFVKLAQGYELSDELKGKIKNSLRKQASPRHVPAMIFEAPDIPYTFSSKKVEVAVTNILHGRAVKNRDALRNPESLDFFEGILPEIQNTK